MKNSELLKLRIISTKTHKIKYRIFFILILSITISCQKENIRNSQMNSTNEAISKMPDYYKLILYLKIKGYTFWSYNKYMNSDRNNLPEKLVLLRHDVHRTDIVPAYFMFRIEKELLIANFSTYFIMLNDPTEYSDSCAKNEYLDLISYLHNEGADVQPHISPNDMIADYMIEDSNWSYNADQKVLQELFDYNYKIISDSLGRELQIVNEDIFDLNNKLDTLSTLLINYNNTWESMTGLEVEGYAAHGSQIPINKVFNNAIILDLKSKLNEGIYEYEAYNTCNFANLTYLSDNSLPEWMCNPELITDCRIKMLCHPYSWYIRN